MGILRNLITKLYNMSIRPLLPRKIASLNGVPVRYVRLFDANDVLPEYEASLVRSIQQYVDNHAEAVIIGGGTGVSTVTTARQLDPKATITVFEGGAEQISMIDETVKMASIEPEVNINHAIVGEPVQLRSNPENATRVLPTQLPSSDVLIMDCEGSEQQILAELEDRPKQIIVETHGVHGAPTTTIENQLEEMGYEIVSKLAEIESQDVFVLTARLHGRQ